MTDATRALALAHVLDIMAIATRNGRNLREIADVIEHASLVAVGPWPEQDYRAALHLLDVSAEDIDAAVVACGEGRHPVGSLVARVERYEETAETAGVDAAELDDPDYETGRAQGKCDASAWMLAMLGVTP